jgi:tol-pal system protein YbgF
MRRLLYLLLAGSLFLWGCASTDEYQSLRAELNQLKSDYYSDIRSLKDRMRALEESSSRAATQETITGLRESQERILNQITDLRKEIQMIQGRLDEDSYRAEKTLRDASTERDLLRAEIGELKTSLNELAAKVETLKQAPPPAQPSLKEGAGDGEVKPKPTVKTPEMRYQEALDLLNGGKFKEAREAFESFLEAYPSMELSDNAQFWLAESYYREKNFEDAILAYERLIKKFPKSDKVPGAMLKQAYAFRELGDRNTTQVILKTLKSRFPDSREAEIADKELEKMSGPAETSGQKSPGTEEKKQ